MAICVPKQSVVALIAALILASCAGPPIVRWKRESPAKAAASMESAMLHLESARGTYREAVIDQMERESGVSNVVLGAGALVALLAAGKGGSDAILGVAAIGGTAYAMGNLTLRRQRVMVYQAGVDALDCAQQAATPFNVSIAEVEGLTRRVNDLQSAQTNLLQQIARAEAVRDKLPPSSPDHNLLKDTLASAATSRQAANNALSAGHQFIGSVGGAAGQLVATVDRVDSAVIRSLVEATPDLSSIKAQVAGMPEMIGVLAPSLQTRTAAGLEKLSTAAAKSNLGGSLAEQANQALAAASLDTEAATDRVVNQLKTRTVVGTADAALKACNVSKTITELATDRASLSFLTGVASVGYIEVRGGVPPYDSEFEGALVDGVSEKIPAASNRIQVSVSNKVTGPHQLSLRISDQSQPRKVLSIPVTLSAVAPAVPVAPAAPAAPASAPKVPAKKPLPAAGTQAQQVANAINSKNPFTHAGKQFGITGTPTVSGSKITVVLVCPGNTPQYSQDELAKSVLAQAGINTTPKPAWTLQFAGACVAG